LFNTSIQSLFTMGFAPTSKQLKNIDKLLP